MSLKWKILLTLAVLFSYYKITTWKYIIATIVIIFVFNKYYPQNFKEKLGLNFIKRQIPYGFLICIFCAVIAEFGIQYMLSVSNVIKDRPLIFSLWFLQPLFQSLNEEMLLRALFLNWLVNKFKTNNEWYANLTMALVFTVLHFLFCSVLFDTSLDIRAGLVFLITTIAMNTIFFKTRTILFTWAIHLGINFSFFGGNYIKAHSVLLNDAEKFNLIYGTNQAVVASLIFAIVIYILLHFYKISFNQRQVTNR